MQERHTEASCCLHRIFQLHIPAAWGRLFSGGFFLLLLLLCWSLCREPVPGDEKGLWVRSYLFKLWDYVGKRFGPNEDFGYRVAFIYIGCFGFFLLRIIESWLNMSTTQLNITLWGKFILCTPLPFYCDEKRIKKQPRDSTGCNFNRSFPPVLTFTKFW